MANRTAEVIDLKTYRERKAAERSATTTADSFADHLQYGQVPMPFAMPVAFFVLWPTWVFTPQFTSASSKGGSGVA